MSTDQTLIFLSVSDLSKMLGGSIISHCVTPICTEPVAYSIVYLKDIFILRGRILCFV